MGETQNKNRTREQVYPDFGPEMARIEAEGASAEVVREIIKKHAPCAAYNRALYERYRGVSVPVYGRRPRFEGDGDAINNRLGNDFFGEIVDLKTGYFAGKPIGYSYSVTAESRAEVGDEAGVEAAAKALTDFVARNNLYDVDMECTKYATCCGYAARLLYHDEAGVERVMAVAPFEAAILSRTDIARPMAAVRYYVRPGEGAGEEWFAEYYDGSDRVLLLEGGGVDELEIVGEEKNLFGGCPLQGIPNNAELQADAEKVLSLIDAYDRALSDAGNELESFAAAYMLFENINISDEDMKRGQRAGAFRYFNGGGAAPGKISFLTKEVNDGFFEHHLDRLQNNIYRFSKTPNLCDEGFSRNASGVALKFKLTGLETKCGMFQAKMQSAGLYMFELLAASLAKKGVALEPLQCVMDFHRNFPLDLAGEAEAVGTLVDAGVPKRLAFGQLSFVEDVEYVMQLAAEERGEAADPQDEGGEAAQPDAGRAGEP